MTLDEALAKIMQQQEPVVEQGPVTADSDASDGIGASQVDVNPNTLSRIVREMQALLGSEAHPAFTILPSSEDALFWRLLVSPLGHST